MEKIYHRQDDSLIHDCESVSKKEFWAILRLDQLFFMCQIPSQGPMHKNCKTHNKLCSIVQFTTNGSLVNFSSQYIDVNIRASSSNATS